MSAHRATLADDPSSFTDDAADWYGPATNHLIFISGTSGIVSISSSDRTMCSVPVLYLRKCGLLMCAS